MSGDDKPSRFAMISEEMVNPPELTKVEVSLDPGGLTWSGEATVCPRCKLGAFELASALTKQVRIMCLGCPPPAPEYFLPEGTKVRVNPYRCCRCAGRARVTMTLSEVNLHCRACRQLTLHTRQDQAPKKSTTSIMSFLMDENPKTSLFTWVDFDKPSGVQSVDARFENITLGVPYQPETNPRDIDKLIDRMRVALKLENFFDFAQKRRRMNAELVVQGAYDGNDIARRSGRTTRGLLEAIAKCFSLQKEGLIIQAGSASAERRSYRVVQEIIDRLRIKYPVWVKKRSDFGFRNSIDAVTYVDHTYNER